jgi:diguanylate cyclase (GGDEF)-like protein/PAS domain S-box-containing protein
MLELFTPVTYSILTALCLVILVLYFRNLKQLKILEEREAALESKVNDLVAASEAPLESILRAIPDIVSFSNLERKIISVNRGFELNMGYKIGDLSGLKAPLFYESHEEYVRQDQLRYNSTAEEDTEPYEMNYRRKDGSTSTCETFSKVVKAPDGQLLGYILLTKDITERKEKEEKLELAASVFSHAREGIAITDATFSLVEVNDTYTEITGYSRDELIGQNINMFRSDGQSPPFYAEMIRSIITTGHWAGELWSRRKNGEAVALLQNIDVIYDENGNVKNYVVMCSDITVMKEYQSQLERSAHYDTLTNLPNRILLADRLRQAMVKCRRHQQSVAVVFLDLDGFKAVNDSHGHTVGDMLLIAISQRMKEALREGDTLSRFGGDEYVAVLTDLAKISDCEPVLERLLKAAATPVNVGDTVMQVSASMGVTLYPQDGVDAEQLIRHADHTMYVSKQAGKNRYSFFDTVHDKAVTTRKESLSSIRSALMQQEFVLYYQPKVNMASGDVIGVEALIRWQHPDRGLMTPLNFLPAIESHATSLELGEWVIDTALTQITQWQGMGIQLSISVNISAYQLQQDNFVTRLAELLAAHPEVIHRHLELEVLETGALSDFNEVAETMKACHELGVRFALDDFGTGYSSLTHLRRLPAHLIKIDQSFVRDMLEDADDLAMVEGVIALAKSFKRDVIAEGVETIEHGAVLLKLGCELAQGYGIAKPMPASEIPAWMNGWKPDVSWKTPNDY